MRSVIDILRRNAYSILEFGINLFLINGVHFLIKNYDRSFDGAMDYNSRGVWFHIFFLITGFIFWRGGVLLSRSVHKFLDRDIREWFKITFKTIIFTLYGVVISTSYGAIYYLLFYRLSNQDVMWTDYQIFDPDFNLIIFIFYTFILISHSLLYYFRNWKETQIVAERLKKENIQSQFDALKNQIDPHFFFNSLSVLSSLIYRDIELSEEYINQLSKMYRSILDGRDQVIVSLKEELEFTNSYIFLIKVRYSDNIIFNIDITEESLETIFIPKNSLQMLVENTIKHNKFDSEEPLVVNITEEGDYIKVENIKKIRKLLGGSSGIGLNNIRKRYDLISSKSIIVEDQENLFSVKLPKLLQYEAKHFDI